MASCAIVLGLGGIREEAGAQPVDLRMLGPEPAVDRLRLAARHRVQQVRRVRRGLVHRVLLPVRARPAGR
jgi:hypothetical protein